MALIWTLGKQEFHKAIKAVSKFSRFYHFSHSLQFSFLVFWKTTHSCALDHSCAFWQRWRRPDAGLGEPVAPRAAPRPQQRGGTGGPQRRGSVQPCGISELLNTNLELLSWVESVWKNEHTWKAVGKIQEKNLMNVGFPSILRQFSFLYFLLSVFVLLFLICSGVIQASNNSQHLIFTSIFSLDFEHIFCLFQRAHWISCSCRTDGTTLRFALANGQMWSLYSSPLGEVCLCEPDGQGQRCGNAAAMSGAAPGTRRTSHRQTGIGERRRAQHKNQAQPPSPQVYRNNKPSESIKVRGQVGRVRSTKEQDTLTPQEQPEDKYCHF